jgi:hypothetical protein
MEVDSRSGVDVMVPYVRVYGLVVRVPGYGSIAGATIFFWLLVGLRPGSTQPRENKRWSYLKDKVVTPV